MRPRHKRDAPRWPFVVNRDSPQAQGLVGWWPMHPNGGSNLFDMSGYGNHGTLTNMDPATDWVCDDDGNPTLDFDGTNDYVALAAVDSLNITGPITMTAWVRGSSSVEQSIVGGYMVGVGYPGYGFRFYDLTIPKLSYWSSAYGSWVASSSAWNDGKWHHVAVSVIGTTAAFFGDGKSDGTATTAQPASYSGVRAIGSHSNGTKLLVGQLRDVRIHNVAHPASVIAAMYDPSTRYDLYHELGRKTVFVPAAFDAATMPHLILPPPTPLPINVVSF